jgi:hypothetical protein
MPVDDCIQRDKPTTPYVELRADPGEDQFGVSESIVWLFYLSK